MSATLNHQHLPLTIVMPVYNALPYLHEAIASVLAQTVTAFRLAIYDDHSSDGSYEAALRWAEADDRISVTRGQRRLGPSGSSNAAAALAATDWVARMDADDIMMTDRLAVQLSALRRFPKAVMVGSTFDMVDGQGRLIYKARSPRIGGVFPPIAHPTILYRRSALEEIGGYRSGSDYYEDRDLYLRMAGLGEVVVVGRPLIKVRFAGQHARLTDDRNSVLRKLSGVCPDAPSSGSRLSPTPFRSLAILAAIGSKRPSIFGLMLRKASFAQLRKAIPAAAIVGLAELSPWMARKAWQSATAAREWFEPKAAPSDDIYVWNPQTAIAPDSAQEKAAPVVAGAA